ncbi:curculin-1-like [Carex rostrata]
MRYNGNLVIYSGKKALWSSNIEQTNEDNNVLVMQRDWKCNVVLYGRALWSTGNGHAHWSTGTNHVDTANAPSSLLTHSLGSNILRPGDLLYGDQEINEGSCRLAMQKDCNLVLYDSGMPIWASGTYGAGENCYLSMQYNGNLVLYSRKKALWFSNTRQPDEGNYSLVLQRDWDCNVVLYGRALWSTQKNPVGTANVTISSDSTEPVVIAGDNISMVTDSLILRGNVG